MTGVSSPAASSPMSMRLPKATTLTLTRGTNFANNDPKLKAALNSIINDLRDAKEYGSILTVAPVDFAALYARVEEVQNDISLHREAALATILPLILVAEVMAQQYDVVVTNPPYMG